MCSCSMQFRRKYTFKLSAWFKKNPKCVVLFLSLVAFSVLNVLFLYWIRRYMQQYGAWYLPKNTDNRTQMKQLLRHSMSHVCYIVLYYALLCYVMLNYVTLCYVMLRSVTLCCVILRYECLIVLNSYRYCGYTLCGFFQTTRITQTQIKYHLRELKHCHT